MYNRAIIKALIKLHTSKGFQSSSELKVYSRSFRVIADYLVKHEVLRNDDRDRYFIKGLPDALQVPVLERLRYKCPDVLAPRVPYTVAQVTEAAEFILDAQDEDAPLIAAPQRVVQPAPAPMQQVCYNGPGVSDMDFDRTSPMPHLRLMLLMWMDYTRIRYSYGADTMRQRLIVTVP